MKPRNHSSAAVAGFVLALFAAYFLVLACTSGGKKADAETINPREEAVGHPPQSCAPPQSYDGQDGADTAVTFVHHESLLHSYTMHDDDDEGPFRNHQRGVQALIQKCAGHCNGDFLFDINYWSGNQNYKQRTFFVDLSHPLNGSPNMGKFHKINNFHMKILQLGNMPVGQETKAVGYFASDLCLTSWYNAFKFRFGYNFPSDGSTQVVVTRISKTEWSVDANEKVGDIARVSNNDNDQDAYVGMYHMPVKVKIELQQK